MEKNLFSLSNKIDSYALINGSKMTEELMDKYMEEIAYGLFSVVGTSGCLPVIRCPKVILFIKQNLFIVLYIILI